VGLTGNPPQRPLQVRTDDRHGGDEADDDAEEVGEQPEDAVQLEHEAGDGPAHQDGGDAEEEEGGALVLLLPHEERQRAARRHQQRYPAQQQQVRHRQTRPVEEQRQAQCEEEQRGGEKGGTEFCGCVAARARAEEVSGSDLTEVGHGERL